MIKTVHLDIGIEHPKRGNFGWAKSYSAPEFTIREAGDDIHITREGVTIGVSKARCWWEYAEEETEPVAVVEGSRSRRRA